MHYAVLCIWSFWQFHDTVCQKCWLLLWEGKRKHCLWKQFVHKVFPIVQRLWICLILNSTIYFTQWFQLGRSKAFTWSWTFCFSPHWRDREGKPLLSTHLGAKFLQDLSIIHDCDCRPQSEEVMKSYGMVPSEKEISGIYFAIFTPLFQLFSRWDQLRGKRLWRSLVPFENVEMGPMIGKGLFWICLQSHVGEEKDCCHQGRSCELLLLLADAVQQ